MTGSSEPGPTSPAGRLPDFFIVGHPKSGTTALYEALRSHPRIFMPDLKEPVYFATELPRRAHRYLAPATIEQYTALFEPAGAEQLVGEASASYLWSRSAARGIASLRPDARAVAILREPADFIRSFHLQCLQSHNEVEPDLRRALALEAPRREGRCLPRRASWPQLLLYSEQVRYVEQLRRYRDALGAERLLVLIYDDFRADNEATVRSVLRFLGVDDERPIAVSEANPTVRIRSQALDGVLDAVSVGRGPVSRAAKGTVKTLVPGAIRRRALEGARRRWVLAEADPPDEDLMQELRRRFRPEVAALSEYLDRDLVTLWGYDELA